MKKSLIVIGIIFLIPTIILAQRQGKKFDEYFKKYKSERVSYLTQALDLEVEEAEKFWPVYNEYQAKREILMKEGHSRRGRSGMDTLTDLQMKEMMDTKIHNELKMAELAAKYHKKYKEILPVRKVFILYHAEREFMGHMIDRMKESGRGKRSRPDK